MRDTELEHVDNALQQAQIALDKQADDASAAVTDELLDIINELQRAKYDS